MFEQAIEAYKKAVNVMIRLKQLPKDWYHWQIGYCHKNLAFTHNQLSREDDKTPNTRLRNLDEAKKHLKLAIDHFKLGAARDEDRIKGYLKLADLMSQEDFYSVDNSACEEALEKIDVNELKGEDLVKYYFICGKDYKNKQEFDMALNAFEKAKELIFSKYLDIRGISVSDEGDDTHELIDDVYFSIGSCYEDMGEYKKAAENYMIYAYLNEYTPKGLSGELYGIFGDKFLRWRLYKEAQHCFWKALKRNPENAMNLSKIAVANAYLGRLEEAISNLEKALEVRYSPKDEKSLSIYKEKLKKRKEISFILVSICDIADSAIKRTGREELSEKWYQVGMLLDGIDTRDRKFNEADKKELILSSLTQSIKLDTSNQDAKQKMTKLTNEPYDTLKEKYTIKYHRQCANSLQNINKNPIMEIFHRIYASTINTMTSIHKINVDSTIKPKEKKQWMYSLSDEWGRIGWRTHNINEEHTIKIPHHVAEKCFELSVKLRPNNSTSWHNLGWVRYYIGLYTGDNGYYSKAREAFNESIRLEENGEKEKNHIPLSKIGIGKTYEAEGDATSAEKWFRDSATICTELHGESNEAVESLVKTAEGLEHLRFLNVSDDKKIRFMKNSLEIYKKALEMAQKINPTDQQTLLLREKVRLLEKQIIRAETVQEEKSHGVVTAAPHVEALSPKKSVDEIFYGRKGKLAKS